MTRAERNIVIRPMVHVIVIKMLSDRSVNVAKLIIMVLNLVVVVLLVIVLWLRIVHNVMIKPVNVDVNQVLQDVNVIDAYQAIGIILPRDVCVSKLSHLCRC